MLSMPSKYSTGSLAHSDVKEVDKKAQTEREKYEKAKNIIDHHIEMLKKDEPKPTKKTPGGSKDPHTLDHV